MDLTSRDALKYDLDAVDILLGVWLIVMPLLLGPALPRMTVIVLMAIGLIAAADALWAWLKPELKAPEWVMGAAGVLLFVLPWALAFTDEVAIAWNAWIIGAILAVDAATAYVLVPVGAKSAKRRLAH